MNAPAIHRTGPVPHVAVFEIDVPPVNALGTGPRRELLSALDDAEKDLEVRAVVLTGRGSNFCSGDDLNEREAALKSGGEDADAAFPALIDRIDRLRVPVIAAVNGWAIGGGLELALACDIRIASTAARFVCAAVNVGLIASAWRLPRLIGTARAKHMLLTGLPFDAETAERYGLVTEVHGPDAMPNAALALAERIASRAPLSVEATKRVAGMAADLDAAEARHVLATELKGLIESRDHAEALAAFRERRSPHFRRQ